MMTTYSLIQEMIHNENFNDWCRKHGFTISMFTILSSADVEALHILSSKIAEIEIYVLIFFNLIAQSDNPNTCVTVLVNPK